MNKLGWFLNGIYFTLFYFIICSFVLQGYFHCVQIIGLLWSAFWFGLNFIIFKDREKEDEKDK